MLVNHRLPHEERLGAVFHFADTEEVDDRFAQSLPLMPLVMLDVQ
jgi:hypothetical protein